MSYERQSSPVWPLINNYEAAVRAQAKVRENDHELHGRFAETLGALLREIHRLEAAAGERGLDDDAVDVLTMGDQYASQWRDRDDNYWLQRLMQEVGELASSLAGDHKDPPEYELRQIGSIAINWLRRRRAVREGRELLEQSKRDRDGG